MKTPLFAIFATLLAFGSTAALGWPSHRLLSNSGVVHLVHEGHKGATQASGVVNAVDAVQHKVNISHGSIKSLGWPAMTMDFAVSQDFDLSTIKAGTQVSFTLVRGADGSWVVDNLKPAGGK